MRSIKDQQAPVKDAELETLFRSYINAYEGHEEDAAEEIVAYLNRTEPEVWAVDAPYGTVFTCASRELAEEMAATYQDGKVRRLAYHREKPTPLPCSECGRE